jgi:hypothetical protein
MDRAAWFTLFVALLGLVGAIAAVQQLLEHGWNKFWRAAECLMIVAFPLGGLCYYVVTGPQHVTQTAGASWLAPSPGPTYHDPGYPTAIDTRPVDPEPRNAQRLVLPPPPDRPLTPLPRLLPAEETLFLPSEVLFCPMCGAAYSSQGPKDNVRCLFCGKEVSLKPNSTLVVFRCAECKTLLKISQIPSQTGPFHTRIAFSYYCDICKKTNWFSHPAK